MPDSPTEIRERPLLFSPAMVRAIFAGKTQTRRLLKPEPEWRPDATISKTEFGAWSWGRRHTTAFLSTGLDGLLTSMNTERGICPLGDPGDRLWVREPWRTYEDPATGIDGFLFQTDGAFKPIENSLAAAERWSDLHHVQARPADVQPLLCAGAHGVVVWSPRRHGDKWRPSIHMPRVACRLVLEITEVRVEFVQTLTWQDAIAEGVYRVGNQWTWSESAPLLDTPIQAYLHLWNHINPDHPWDSDPIVWVITFRRLEVTGV